MAILPKGGLQIAGHRVPWEAVGAVAAVIGVIIVIRARQQGQNVASVGQAPYTAASAGFGAPSVGPDYSAALTNITEQLTSLQRGVNGPQPPVQPGAVPPLTSFGRVTSDIGGGYIHSGPDPASDILGFFSGPLDIKGAPVTGGRYGSSTSPGLIGVSSAQWIPVSYGGGVGYIWAPEAHINA